MTIQPEDRSKNRMVLVTGANGFLGSAIVRLLVDAGIPSRATGEEPACLHSGIEYIQADITRSQQVIPAVRGVHTVIHAAGLAHVFEPDKLTKNAFQDINENGTANVMSMAADNGAEHFILISSVAVYGLFTRGQCAETAPCNPVGPYAESKYNAERRAQEIALRSGMNLTILRFSTLYGENDRGNVARLMRAIDRKRFIWIGDGRNRKSLLYKKDAARACLLVATQPASGIRIFNVSSPPCTMQDIVYGLADALGKKPLPGHIPDVLVLPLTHILARSSNSRFVNLHQTVKKWLAEDVYDTHRFDEAYHFHVQTSLKEGLMRQVAWYRKSRP
jgi:UDP-glucose 4-epimerase